MYYSMFSRMRSVSPFMKAASGPAIAIRYPKIIIARAIVAETGLKVLKSILPVKADIIPWPIILPPINIMIPPIDNHNKE